MLFFLFELFFSLDSWFPIYEYFCSGSHIFICFRHNFIFVVGDRIFCFFTKFTSAAAAECMPSELHQAISRSAKADSISPWQKLFPESSFFLRDSAKVWIDYEKKTYWINTERCTMSWIYKYFSFSRDATSPKCFFYLFLVFPQALRISSL